MTVAEATLTNYALHPKRKEVEQFDLAEFRRRIESVRAPIASRAEEAEATGNLVLSTFEQLRDLKLFRIAQPVRFGGVGLDIDQVHEMAFELARSDPSTGWNAAFYALHNHQIGMLALETQEEYWAESYDVQMATASGYVRANFEDKGDSVVVSGEWDYASGVDYADWLQISRITPKGAQQLLIPRAEFEIINNWHTVGARATGSKRVKLENVVVPPHRQLDAVAMANGTTIGRELHPSPFYKLPIFPWMGYVIACAIMGAAQGLVDEFGEQARTRKEVSTGQRFIDRASNQLRFAEASAEIHAARTVHAADVRTMLDWAAADYVPTLVERAAIRRNQGYCVKLALGSAYRLYEMAGAGALNNSNPLQRYYRDVSAMSHSMTVVWDAIGETFSQVFWGLPPASYNL